MPSECSICIIPINEGSGCHIAPCNHEYHVECINKWIDKERTCPQCRAFIQFPKFHCKFCHKQYTSKTQKFCQSCKSVEYCDRKCQTIDWPSHKLICKDIPKLDLITFISSLGVCTLFHRVINMIRHDIVDFPRIIKMGDMRVVLCSSVPSPKNIKPDVTEEMKSVLVRKLAASGYQDAVHIATIVALHDFRMGI